MSVYIIIIKYFYGKINYNVRHSSPNKITMIKKLKIDKFRLFESQEFTFGKRITAISGQNAVGKSTLLGLIGNIIEWKEKNIFGKQYRTDFSEIFKASKDNDKTGDHKGTFYLTSSETGVKDYEISFRSTWQSGDRFRVIPNRKDKTGKKTESKFPIPVIYLGLSRLYPIGETNNKLEVDDLKLSDDETKWFKSKYSTIFTMDNEIKDIINHKTTEIKSNFTGIATEKYDAICNSAGQDNLGQILLSLISFKRLKVDMVEWKGGVLIIDELDATMHPAAQQKLVKILFEEAKSIDLQVIFTTHSLSTLEYVASKYEGLQYQNNDYKLIFISNANEKIKVYTNPSYELIQNNLCLTITQEIKRNDKILVYSEDDDTRWFFKKLIYGYANKLKFINANLGCSDLQKMLKEDKNYFSKVLFVVDGDVKETAPAFVKKKNVLALVDTIRPEQVLYNYLNREDNMFWENDSFEQKGFTKKYLLVENGINSNKYNGIKKERKKYSSWFFDNKSLLEEYKVLEHWKKNNKDIVDEFRKEFIESYNHLAKINGIELISK